MWGIIINRFKQGFRTTLSYPKEVPSFPQRFRGKPVLNNTADTPCPINKSKDPLGAVASGKKLTLDMGKCLFNEDLKAICPKGILTYSQDHRLAVSKKKDLILQGEEVKLARALNEKTRKIFGRSLKLREVCAGSCSGCDAEIQAMGNIVFDLSRFGIQFVASPRHADGLMITGPVTKNMELALKKTYEAVPHPKIVIAVGACAINGGPFQGGRDVHDGVDGLIPVDLYIPGCPPHPLTILDGLLRLLGKLENKENNFR
ncbi:MAG: NADH-quinone oxidoreductase subunit NuoB [Candidatus Omnitrophica bacterium]|nr:NADH-quinone oxidoreductase subunit NuoB [Candidatus Omnitrophota bacterium]